MAGKAAALAGEDVEAGEGFGGEGAGVGDGGGWIGGEVVIDGGLVGDEGGLIELDGEAEEQGEVGLELGVVATAEVDGGGGGVEVVLEVDLDELGVGIVEAFAGDGDLGAVDGVRGEDGLAGEGGGGGESAADFGPSAAVAGHFAAVEGGVTAWEARLKLSRLIETGAGRPLKLESARPSQKLRMLKTELMTEGVLRPVERRKAPKTGSARLAQASSGGGDPEPAAV